jgi:adenylate cyclase
MSEGTKRRLAAIVSADVVGYSRLMQADEAGTHARLRARFRELVAPSIERYGGRVFKLMGDGLLAEFPSVVAAAEWAVEVQDAVAKANADGPPEHRIEYRVGVNLGDIIVDGDDLYGDGVNVAARLQEVSEPGGVCLSDSSFQQVQGKVSAPFADGGEVSLKNIDGPVRVWHWAPGNSHTRNAPGSAAEQELKLPDKPSIAVLPFDNMSGDPEQEFFADGMAEDIITALSRYRWFFVIARNSSFTYKGRAVDVKQVARELGVHYVLEGSVRKAGNRMRVTTQLIDAVTGNHIWAERYDRELDDIFALQDEITETIVIAIEPELAAVEAERARRKPTESLDAWSAHQRGLWHLHGVMNRESIAEARQFFRRVCALDPSFAAAYAYLSYTHSIDIVQGYTDDPETSLEEAARAAETAVALDARDPMARSALGRVHLLRHSYERAIAELEAAISLNTNSDRAVYGLGVALLCSGRPEEAISQFKQAIRLSPKGPILWAPLQGVGWAYLSLKKCEDALPWLEKAIQQPTAGYMPFAFAAAALSCLSRLDEARDMFAEAKRRKPDFSAETFVSTRGPLSLVPGTEWFVEALRKAGAPE